MGTQMEGTHLLGSTHAEGAHPQLPTQPTLATASLPGTECPQSARGRSDTVSW